MRHTSLIVALLLLGSAACSGNKTGVCVSQTNCFLNQQERMCNDSPNPDYREGFVPSRGLDESVLICKGFGYAFTNERDEAEQREKARRGELASMGWTIPMMEHNAAAHICGGAGGGSACVPWTPPVLSK